MGRYPANYLMPRMPISEQFPSFITRPCDLVSYGVLVRVSTGYPPLGGRLHTRYAPIRRSPPVCCHTALPLDLHVLGLPLAFILSQDQTLHCKNCFFAFLTHQCLPAATSVAASDTRYLLSQNFKSLSLSQGASPCRKRVQRYDLFPFRQIYFSLQPLFSR